MSRYLFVGGVADGTFRELREPPQQTITVAKPADFIGRWDAPAAMEPIRTTGYYRHEIICNDRISRYIYGEASLSITDVMDALISGYSKVRE